MVWENKHRELIVYFVWRLESKRSYRRFQLGDTNFLVFKESKKIYSGMMNEWTLFLRRPYNIYDNFKKQEGFN